MTENRKDCTNQGENPGKRKIDMEKAMIVSLATLILAGMVFSFAFSGCSPNEEYANADNGNGPGANIPPGTNRDGDMPGRPRDQGNMTDSDREAMMQQRIAEATAACNNLAEGESCAVSSPMGEMQGTCAARDGIVMCDTGLGERQPPQDSTDEII